MILATAQVLAGSFLQVFAQETWPKEAKKIEILSSADQSLQPSMMYVPTDTSGRFPLLVALHTWSGDYRQPGSIHYLDWSIEHQWAFIHPNYRGPNRTPDSGGSQLVIQDIIDAVDYMKQQYSIDTTRIYLIGGSGGGYNALQVVSRFPDIWAGVSVWVPISNLADWYQETRSAGLRYADDIIAVTGGIPGSSQEVDQQYYYRSPVFHLSPEIETPIDISAGIRDGHQGSVPVSHSMKAYNALAAPSDTLIGYFIDYVRLRQQVPEWLPKSETDLTYPDDKKVLFRRVSENVRLTLFDGAHDILYDTGLKWLERQQKGTSARF